jgi:CO dehydrogenase maturation factor
MIRIAIAGKGGVGKTLTAAGIAQAFAQSGKRTLAIDADPSPNLALLLGLSAAESEKILPISRNEDLIRAKTATRFPGVYNLNFTVDDIVRNYSVATPAGIHLIVVGTIRQMGEGCFCPANTVIRTILHHLITGQDDAIVIDMEAGVEHLGRGTAENVDLFLVVTTADSRALATAGSIARIAQEAMIPHIMMVGNRIRDTREEEIIRAFARDRKIPILGFIPFDPRVIMGGIAGESILQMKDSVALHGIGKMAEIILDRFARIPGNDTTENR